jgi:hypothetical protein
MASKRETAQRERSDAREQRRNGQDDGSNDEQTLDGVKQAAKVAAASIALGAVTAAAKALAERRHSKPDDDHQQDSPEPETKQQGTEQPEASEPEQEEHQAEPEQREPEQEPEPEHREDRHEPVAGATEDEAGGAVDAARRHLEVLVGKPQESVSSLERTDNGWLVTIEVVEVSRVPESTDVLASYEVELDDERNLRRYARVRRYNRSQSDREGMS